MTFKNLTDEPLSPWIAVFIEYIAPTGNTFEQVPQVAPDDIINLGDLYEGGEGTGTIVFEVPSDATSGGQWAVSGFFTDTLYVDAGN